MTDYPWVPAYQVKVKKKKTRYLTSFPPCAKAPNEAVNICKKAKSRPVLGSSVTCIRASIRRDIPRDLARSLCASLRPPFSWISSLVSHCISLEGEQLKFCSSLGVSGACSLLGVSCACVETEHSEGRVNVTVSSSHWLLSSGNSFWKKRKVRVKKKKKKKDKKLILIEPLKSNSQNYFNSVSCASLPAMSMISNKNF